ncbi:glutamine synthetase [Azospirillum cavernae]|uniref:Glutamine synthetase n=1 Tax=Azospirillum cavernae TaxID=2320860 RepID=A0A418VMF7_9PROT|nr:glutamine synthetase family protein [Azospirillum cavernae]RJF77325.1 glutamine synthetase [Azospirillum cavernae]
MGFMEDFIKKNRITEVECLVPDISGIARGKIVPADKFLRILRDRGLRLPEAIFVQTVTGEFAEDEDITSDENSDIYMIPDERTIRFVPWYEEPTAQVIVDCVYADSRPVDMSPRHVLKRVLSLYEERGWKPQVAPELEFFLVQVNKDPDYPLVPPIGRNGRMESGRQAFGIDAVNEFDPIFEAVYDYCEKQDIDIDTLTHEAGAAQIEINFNHGDALELADQAFLFKRTAREAAIRHNIYATFMAKPMQGEPGSAMHIHQSVVDADTGRNLFSNPDGTDSALFMAHIAGLQKYLPYAMPLLAPNVNSYRRLVPNSDAPINVHWGRDNRTTGLRVPVSQPDARRVENRVAGADANPYLAIAASLACGYIGMTQNMEPNDPIKGSAYRLAFTLPRHQSEALTKFNACKPLKEILGERFIDAVTCVKEAEYKAYNRVISSWERENLLLNV